MVRCRTPPVVFGHLLSRRQRRCPHLSSDDQGLIGFDVGTEGWIVRPEWPQTP